MKEQFKILLLSSLKRSSLLRSFLRLCVVIFALGIITPHATLLAQGITVTGVVTDGNTGEPLLGVNIVVQGTTTGTVTDLTGKYTINVPSQESMLVFSFVGYISQTVAVGTQRMISITLSPDVAALEEVVVVGYGVQKKESVVGAISTATQEKIKQGIQGSDLGIALQGSLPGLSIMRNGGLPGGKDFGRSEGNDDDYAYMYIRGQKTWNSYAPLVLVDGVERPLNNINPYEIEKISILKDASATSVFGVKGANGVILITTLHGKEGRPKLTFDATFSAKTLSKVLRRENSYWANLMKNYGIRNEVPCREAAWTNIVPYKYLEYWRDQTYPEIFPDQDWVDLFVKDWSYDQNASLSLSGGTRIVKYFGSLSYAHEGDLFNIKDYGQGYSPNFNFDRFNFRSNLDFDITPTTRFTANLAGYYIAQQRPNGSKWALWHGFYSHPPDVYPFRYSDGTWGDYQAYARIQNGLYLAEMFGIQLNKETQVTTDFILFQQLDVITKGLSAQGKLSFDNRFIGYGPEIGGSGAVTKWIPQSTIDSFWTGMTKAQQDSVVAAKTIWQFPIAGGSHGFDFVMPPNTYSSETATNASTYRNLYYELSLNYSRDFGKHAISGLGLMSRQEQATGSAFPSYREDWVGRVTYGYDRRYNLELNAAYNGSEKFASKYRFGFFPSYAMGWTISNEPFFESIRPIISNLKVRYSDGKIGSDAGIVRWQYLSSWIVKQTTTSTSSTDVWRFGAPYIQNALPLRYEGSVPNPDLQWELAQKRDLGIETGFFDNVLRVSVDYFWEKRTNIFMSGGDIVIPEYFGRPPVSQNLGRVDAHGWEYEFQFSKTWANGLNIWATHSWTFAKDKVIERADPKFKPDYQKAAGYPIGQPRQTLNADTKALQTWNEMYNVQWGTSIPTYALPGDWARIDYNADGIIDSNDAIPWGYPSRPQYTYAPAMGVNYKNIGFNVRFYGVYNIEGGLSNYLGNFTDGFSIVHEQFRPRNWCPELGLTENATWSGWRFLGGGTSGYFDRPRSYFRFQHAELSYLLTNQWIKKAGISNLKFILSGENLKLWSKMFEDLDTPQQTWEANSRRSYPVQKYVKIGLSFNFQ